ncbi:MAG: hypothetical protein ACI83W_001538 [Marinoscillum sp.]|jgi:hypothetical protein
MQEATKVASCILKQLRVLQFSMKHKVIVEIYFQNVSIGFQIHKE